MGVLAEDRERAVGLLHAGREADGDTGRHADRPGHRRERPGELLAVPDALAQERLDGVVAVALGHVEAVRELGPEPVLHGHHGVIGRRRPRRHRHRRLADRGREVGRQLQVDRVRRRGGGGRTEHVGGEAGHRRRDLEAVARLQIAVDADDGRRLGVPPQPLARGGDRLGRARHELALQRADGDQLVVGGGSGRGDGEVAVDVVQRPVGQPPRAAVELGQPTDTPVRPRRRLHDEQLGRRPVDETGPDVDERAEHLGHTATVVVRLDERIGAGAGQARADRPRPEHDHGAGDGDRRQGDRQRAAGVAEHRARDLGEAHPQQRGGQEPGPHEGQRERDAMAIGPERGDEHEEHGTGDQRLTPGVGAEGERVRRRARRTPCR